MVPMLCHCTLAVSIVTHREGRRGEGGENGTHAVSLYPCSVHCNTQRGEEGGGRGKWYPCCVTVPLQCPL